jgi:hypothetical protein
VKSRLRFPELDGLVFLNHGLNEVFVMDDVRFPIPPSLTKFMDQLRAFIRLDGKSYATEQVYLYWVKQFILF